MSSAIPTPEEFVPRMARVYYLNTVTSISTSLSYGVFLCLYTQAAKILYRKAKASSQAARYLLLVTTLLFLLGTLRFTSTISLVLLQESWEGRTPDDMPLYERVQTSRSLLGIPSRMAYFVSPITFLLSDSIVVWRAYVICSKRLWIRVFLATLISCAAVFMIFTPIFALIRGYDLVVERVDSASIFLSLIVNFIATACISIEARSINQAYKEAKTRPGPITSVFWLLTEAGVFFCIIQLVNAVLTLYIVGHSATDPRMLSGAFFEEFTIQYAAMYPCIVIVLIAGRRSLVDMAIYVSNHGHSANDLSDKESSAGQHAVSTIEFAASPTSPATEASTQTSKFGDAAKIPTSL